MLNVGLDTQLTRNISTNTPFAWSPNSSLPYLGICLTFPSNNLVKQNFEDLVEKLSCLAKDMGHSPASWAGRIAQVKMYLLSPVLYLFRTNPLHLLQSHPKKLQRIKQFDLATKMRVKE